MAGSSAKTAADGAERRRYRRVVAAVGVYLGAYVAWQLAGTGGHGAKLLVGDLAFVPIYTGAVWTSARAAGRCREDQQLRSAWRLISIGSTFYLAGILIQAYYENVAGPKPFPSLADPFYLSFYPFVLAGVLRFPYGVGSLSERFRTLIDCGVVAVAGAAVVWYVVLGPATLLHGTSLQTLVSVGAPVGDLVLMAGVATALLRRTVPSSERALAWLAVGLVCVVAADLVYGWTSLHSVYSGGDPVDGLYLTGLSCFLIGATAQRSPEGVEVVADAGRKRRPSWLPWLGPALLFVLLAYAVRHEPFVPVGGLLVSAAAVAMLVAARQLFVQRELLRIHRDLEAAHTELAALATTDPVTMLPNHRALISSINRELARSRRSGVTFALVFFDVDHFKAYNDRLGHAAGDAALREFGAVARTCLRESDIVGRWGGRGIHRCPSRHRRRRGASRHRAPPPDHCATLLRRAARHAPDLLARDRLLPRRWRYMRHVDRGRRPRHVHGKALWSQSGVRCRRSGGLGDPRRGSRGDSA